MTVSSTSRVAGPFLGTGANATLPFAFAVFATSDVQLQLADGTPVSSTVSINADQTASPGGSVSVLATNYTSGVNFYVVSVVPETQSTSLPSQGPWLPKIVEAALDRITALVQQLRFTVNRAILVPTGQTAPSWTQLSATFKGDPGGNVLSIGSFQTAALGITIGLGTTVVRTSECKSGSGKGAAFYRYDAAVDSAFVALHPGWAFLETPTPPNAARGFRLAEDQILRMSMFGAVIDGATDDYPVWLVAKDYLQTYKQTHGNPYYKSVQALLFDRGRYFMSDAIDLTEGVYWLRGEGPSAGDQGGGVQLLVAAGKCGIICQSWDTTGVTGTTTNTAKGSAGSRIQDIYVFSQGGTVGAEQHGFLIKSPVFLDRCGAYHFGGCGFLVAADVTHAGNANCGKLRDCFGWYNGRDGVQFVGGDSNAWEVYGFNAIGNRRWGINEISFLGNHFYGYHTAANGLVGSGPSWYAGPYPVGACSASAHWYRAIPGQETWCSTNGPSGTTASNQGWQYYGDAAADANHPAWVTGMTWQAGGAFYVTGASNKAGVFGGYMESDQLNGYCDNGRALLVCGGFSGFTTPPGIGAQLGAFNAAVSFGNILCGSFLITGTELQYGPECFIQPSGSETFDLRGNLGISRSMYRNSSAAQHPYTMGFDAGIVLGATNSGFVGIGTAIPSSGTYSQGATIWNSAPAAAGVPAWRCTTGGVAGSTAVFKAMANLAA